MILFGSPNNFCWFPVFQQVFWYQSGAENRWKTVTQPSDYFASRCICMCTVSVTEGIAWRCNMPAAGGICLRKPHSWKQHMYARLDCTCVVQRRFSLHASVCELYKIIFSWLEGRIISVNVSNWEDHDCADAALHSYRRCINMRYEPRDEGRIISVNVSNWEDFVYASAQSWRILIVMTVTRTVTVNSF